MKRVQITISPPERFMPPVYRLLTREASYLSAVDIVNWNVAQPPVGFLLRLRGDYERLEETITDVENVRECEFFANGPREAYCFLAASDVTVGRALFENFTRDDLLTVPPIACHDDGSSTFTIIGTEAAIQDAVDGVPNDVDVLVEAVGTGPVAPNNVAEGLSPKQRRAVEVAVRVGYYEVPRQATTEDVADELGCATATASEHLRKAEANILSTLCGDRTG